MHTQSFKSIGNAVAIAIFSVAVLFSLVTVRFVAKPQWESLSRNHCRLAGFKKSSEGPGKPDSLKKVLMAQTDSLAVKCKALQQFDDRKDLPSVLRMLIEKANAADIAFVKMQPRSETAPDKAGPYPVVLEMTASYHSLGRFVSSLEEAPHLVHIDRIALTVGPKAMLDIKIQLTCFLKGNG
jgi:Tfp pilus assembly protein PilO